MLISIDPGLNGCGVAAWEPSTKLVWAGYVKNLRTDSSGRNTWCAMVNAVDVAVAVACDGRDNLRGVPPTSAVLEIPQVYVRNRSKGDPNDLIMLAGLVGAFAYRFAEGHVLYKPAEWKGQVKKEITEMRARKRLSPEELARVQLPSAKSLAHNVWDGVALGLFHFGR